MKKAPFVLAVVYSALIFSCKQEAEQKEPPAEPQKQIDSTSIGISKDGINVETKKGDKKTSVTISKDTAGVSVETPPK